MHNPIEATFLCENVFEYSAENQYDFVVCQAVLRHLDNPAAFIQKMITFAKPDGYVVCIDANREFECCGLYIDGMDYQELCKHEGLDLDHPTAGYTFMKGQMISYGKKANTST